VGGVTVMGYVDYAGVSMRRESEKEQLTRRLNLMTKLTRLVAVVLVALVFAMPAIAHDTQKVAINGGASYTTTREAVLALVYTGVPVPTQMRVRNEGEEWPEWEPYNSMKQWLLSEKDGGKTVYVETRYWIGVGWHTLSDNSSITYDTTPPVIRATLSVKANANGWNNTDVAVTFQATDALSGVESVTGDTTVTTEGQNQSVTGQAVDKAGNAATFVVAGISIDKTAPNVSSHANPGADAMVWNNTDVSISFDAADLISGVDSIEGNTLLTDEGANQSVIGTAVDKAGNVASTVLTNMNIDKTLPALTIPVSGTASKPTGEPLDVLALLGSFDGFKRDNPIFAAGAQFFDEDGNIIANALVTLAIQEIISSPEPGTPGVKMVGFTTCKYSSVSQQYYALFPSASVSDGVYELWFTTNTRQSVRARIALKQTPE